MSLVHIVLVKPRDGAEPRALAVLGELADLAARLGAGEVHTGPNVSTEPFGGGFTAGAAFGFPGERARDAYLQDPRHLDLARELGAAAEAAIVADLPARSADLDDLGAT
ncbi:Dabb family protein [Actinomadura viridis]|uniref:Dabb family protein n=1 Tax=Actinomadura viridis TaxID=58110 RepID=UPI0036A4F8DC